MQWLKAVVLVIAAACSFELAAQEAPKTQTVRGCLETSEGVFILTTGEGSLELTGSVDFTKHLGHTVEVTGEPDGGYFAVESLTHIAPSCEAAAALEQGEVRDRPALDAQDQGGSSGDREMSAAIRRAVVADETLSTYAHNVKIITRDGRVTLLGPVRSPAEKSAVAAKAKAIAGDMAVDDQMTIQPRGRDEPDEPQKRK